MQASLVIILPLFFMMSFEIKNVVREDEDLYLYSSPVCVNTSSPWLIGSFMVLCIAIGGGVMIKYQQLYHSLVAVLNSASHDD